MTKREVEQLQHDLNRFTDKYLYRMHKLRVDGRMGPATRKRIIQVKFYCGYSHDRMTAAVDHEFRARMAKPRYATRLARGTLKQRLAAVGRGIARRRKQRKLSRENERKTRDWRHLEGFAEFDGETVPAWSVHWLQKTRDTGRWHGVVVSGVRTPEYSEHLCESICGHPTCPGRCAGRSSNHNMEPDQGYPYGALDVSDYDNFGEVQREIGSPLRNALPNDPVHYSVTGH